MCAHTRSRCSELRFHGVDNGGESTTLQGCTADKEAVDVRLQAKLLAVLVVHRAPVLDAHRVADLLGNVVLQPLAQVGMDLLCLIRCGDLASADCPNWLIGQDHLLPISLT